MAFFFLDVASLFVSSFPLEGGLGGSERGVHVILEADTGDAHDTLGEERLEEQKAPVTKCLSKDDNNYSPMT